MNKTLLCCILAAIGIAGCGVTIGHVTTNPETVVFRPPKGSPIAVDPTTMIFYCPRCGECSPEIANREGFTTRPYCSNGVTGTYRCQRTQKLFGVGHQLCAEIIWVGYWNLDWLSIQTDLIHAQFLMDESICPDEY